MGFIVLAGYSIVTLRRRDRDGMKGFVAQLGCKIVVAAVKLVAGLVAASYLHFKVGYTNT
jgi:hypothetical protein